MRRTTTTTAAALLIAAAAHADSNNAISLITSEIFDIPTGPLLLPGTDSTVAGYIGTGLTIDNDGNWYAAFTLGISNPSDTLQTGRDVVFTRNGLPFNREGFQLPGNPDWTPQAEESTRTSGGVPYNTARIAADGTVGQRLGGVTGFSLLPDGTPNPGSVIPFAPLDTFQLAVIDNNVIAAEGQPFEPISSILNAPDTPAPGFDTGTGAIIEDISLVWPVSATEAYLTIRFEEGGGGTFGDSAQGLFRVTGIGTAEQTAEIVWINGSGFQFAPLGIELDSSAIFNEGIEVAPDGSFVTTVDIDGAPFDQADAVVAYDAPADTFSIVARAGDPAPTGDGRLYQFIDTAVAINDNNDIAFVADDNGASADDTFIVVNGNVVAREGDIVGTIAPAPLQDLTDLFGGRNLELDDQGNVIWPGVWSTPSICDGFSDSGFGIFNAIFFNDQPLIEAGVTEIHDVQIGPLFFETLVVKDILNSEAGGFTVSPDGDTLIAAVFAVEPSDNICDFSTNVSTQGQFLIIEVDLEAFRNPVEPVCPGDTDNNNTVGPDDLFTVLANFGTTTTNGPADGDVAPPANPDASVGPDDLFLVLANFGQTCP